MLEGEKINSRSLCGGSKIEGSQATARQTAVLLRSVISQQRIPYTHQAAALIDAVKAVGEQLVLANPVGMPLLLFRFWSLLV